MVLVDMEKRDKINYGSSIAFVASVGIENAIFVRNITADSMTFPLKYM